MPKVKRIVFHVDEKQAEALKAQSKRTGAPVAELLRRSLSQPLVGKFFHSVKADKETIEWQGEIKSEVRPGFFLVQLFDWVVGAESNQMIVPMADMVYWKIYDSAQEMNNAYQNYDSRLRRSKKERTANEK